MPPPVDMPVPIVPTEAKRSGIRYVAAVLLVIIGLQFVIIGFLDVTGVLYYVPEEHVSVMGALYKCVMFVVAVAAAAMIVMELDFGRILGAGVAGVAIWIATDPGTSLVSGLLNLLFNLDLPRLPSHYAAVVPAFAGVFGIATLLFLAVLKFRERA